MKPQVSQSVQFSRFGEPALIVENVADITRGRDPADLADAVREGFATV
eukprot:CAMPEP_0180643900 /NCGR_PEP_ID=MMETSP1037_2-20121125/48099_1 /TAXON_ID=632150 /ORGANISM="Azadinium spinosum, Strain 3D9" /LENGTH=47 /DNA_ID= /DNA_START= /DNA_END= /DNA_ORIENTATION=